MRFLIAPLRKDYPSEGEPPASEGGGERSAPPPSPQPDKAPASDWDAYQERLRTEAEHKEELTKEEKEKQEEQKKEAQEKREDQERENRERAENGAFTASVIRAPSARAASDYQARRR